MAALAVLALSMLFAAPMRAAEPEQPIRLAINDWTGQQISTQLMGAVLTRAGYRVEYVDADYMDQLEAIQDGRIDVAMEYWSTAGMPALQAALETGKVTILGETGMIAREEWWYPDYVRELCPGLPDWRALNACAAIFAVPETAPKGRYLGGPVTWGGFDEERVEAFGLDYVVQHAGTEADLYDTLEEAIAKREPILLWVYAPHWVPVRHAGDWVDFPAYSHDCYAHRLFRCGKPSGPIWKVGSSALEERAPVAVQAIKAFRITDEEMGELIARVDVDGAEIDQAVSEWMTVNQAVWKSWLD